MAQSDFQEGILIIGLAGLKDETLIAGSDRSAAPDPSTIASPGRPKL